LWSNCILKITEKQLKEILSIKLRRKTLNHFSQQKEVGKGSGQGLAISYDIVVNKHNGAIEVESKQKEREQIFRKRKVVNILNTPAPQFKYE